jgi:hypothetical protein
VPENIPHSAAASAAVAQAAHGVAVGQNGVVQHVGSPIKESSYLQRETSAEDVPKEAGQQEEEEAVAV